MPRLSYSSMPPQIRAASDIPAQTVEAVGQSFGEAGENAVQALSAATREAVNSVTNLGYSAMQATVGAAANTAGNLGYRTVVGGADAIKQTALGITGGVLAAPVAVVDSFKEGAASLKNEKGLKGVLKASWHWTGGVLVKGGLGLLGGAWRVVSTPVVQFGGRSAVALAQEGGTLAGNVSGGVGNFVKTVAEAPAKIGKPLLVGGFRMVGAPFHYVGVLAHRIRALFPPHRSVQLLSQTYNPPVSSTGSLWGKIRDLARGGK